MAIMEEHAEFMCRDGEALKRLGERVGYSGQRLLTLLADLKALS